MKAHEDGVHQPSQHVHSLRCARTYSLEVALQKQQSGNKHIIVVVSGITMLGLTKDELNAVGPQHALSVRSKGFCKVCSWVGVCHLVAVCNMHVLQGADVLQASQMYSAG